MNGLSNLLYNVYIAKKTANELWESLDRKYKTKDIGSKLGPKGEVSKKPEFQLKGKCFNCDKMGHESSECKAPKKKKNHKANMDGG
ncbi:hypothetical protein Q3G72_017560 [Acer saccharum]|nr:hypothetical protein Q3G72_017560 [Acer saccharum]